MPSHEDTKLEGRYLYSILITSVVLIAEVAGGIWTGSLALLSDSAHVFTDILALVISYAAFRLARKPSDDNHTYGYHRVEVFAALFNGISLAVICIGIWWEAIQRFLTPNKIMGIPMLIIAVIGLVANVLVALVLKTDHHDDHDHDHGAHGKEDLNLHSAYLHVIGDALSSIGVILAGFAIWLTGAVWIDPLISILIGIMIAVSSYRVLRRAVHILLEGTPEEISIPEIASAISKIDGVADVHDLHIWNICSGHISLSTHVSLTPECCDKQSGILEQIRTLLLDQFSVEHVTIQIESENCGQGNRIVPRPAA
ncbi:cation diffusion facilitator family transporter [Leptolinea tardivitalis]|nr:cation diffusion facilitator family transporter [Leptolinea tardivitalis]GAP22056.1 cation diffusion facilitator family transporter [Leptolinea tardivitalis]